MNLHARFRWIRSLTVLAMLALESHALADTIVTTYVTRTQEERKSTRFTLDEWLKTKERMRLMDVWLAMMSDTKERFRPELNVEYSLKKGELRQFGLNEETTGSTQGDLVRGQLWFTNLISGTTGLRTLNIDLGISGMYDELKKSSFIEAHAPAKSSKFVAASFRLFGKSTQDTTLVLSYGRHQTLNNLLVDDPQKKEHVGAMVSGGLQVYVTHFIGAEANYLKLGTNDSLSSSASYSAYTYDYSGFVEVSLLRIQFGRYYEAQRLQGQDGTAFHFSDSGYFAGVKMFL